MNDLYRSRIGEVRTKQYWIDWFQQSLKVVAAGLPARSGYKAPTNYWERVEKILKLEKVV